MSNHTEIWTPAEKTKQNFRAGRATGRLLGWSMLGVPAMLVGSVLAVRQCFRGEGKHDHDPQAFPENALWQRSLRVIHENRLKGDPDDD